MGHRGKLRTVEGPAVGFWCPGCEQMHVVTIAPHPKPWGFNQNYDAPTFTPSVLVTSGHYAPGHKGDCWCTFKQRTGRDPDFRCECCHSFVKDGKIQFLGDSTHALAGQTVDLPFPPGD